NLGVQFKRILRLETKHRPPCRPERPSAPEKRATRLAGRLASHSPGVSPPARGVRIPAADARGERYACPKRSPPRKAHPAPRADASAGRQECETLARCRSRGTETRIQCPRDG